MQQRRYSVPQAIPSPLPAAAAFSHLLRIFVWGILCRRLSDFTRHTLETQRVPSTAAGATNATETN